MIKKDCIQKIIDRSRLDAMDLVKIAESFASETPRKEGASYKTSCPLCGCSHSLVITPGKSLFKCFSCNDLTGKDPLAYLMKGQRMDYIDAVRWLGNYYNIYIEEEQPFRKSSSGKGGRPTKDDSFCKRMLLESGLDREDLMATVIDGDNNVRVKKATITPGSISPRGDLLKTGDDAVIHYYDLEGKPMQYTLDQDKSAAVKTYYRVRYQFPAEHKDKNGREMKYRSPIGAPTFIYIPQKIRTLYQTKKEIPVLYIQEGEKKAEKACKHGIDSIAISGIQNLGYKGSLPEEIIRIVETCRVKDVVFLLDGDCFDLSHHLNVNDPIDRRPKNFFYAVRNFKEYFNTLKNRQIYVELYFGHLLKNEHGDKGVDDLLANTLKGHETDLKTDIERAKNEKQMTGQYVRLYKISTITDAKIAEIWHLNNYKEFALQYKEQLSVLPEFTIGKRKYRFNESGEFETAEPLERDEMFWTETKKKEGQLSDFRFAYTGCKNFLSRRGFFRFKRADGDFDFVYMKHPVLKTVRHWEIGDYVRDFTSDCLDKNVLEMLLKGGNQYFGPVAISQMLDFIEPNFWLSPRGVQRFYFANNWWHITANEIAVRSYAELKEVIWDEQKKENSNPTPLPALINVDKTDEGFAYNITDAGKDCQFLRFLENASNFTWRKEDPDEKELYDNAQHLISKLCALGYLVSDGKNKAISKAVVGMDGKQSEVGDSNGRSGKSLLGEAAKIVSMTRYYNGKELNSRNNTQFQWDGINEKTRIVFIDDTTKDFDFEMLFGLITGDWPVNPKGMSAYIIPFEKSPKIYLTTNHALSGEGSSFVDRQWLIAFSDFYNEFHKPIHDFNEIFFTEWSPEQWNLFWNLIAQCVQLYFRFGCVQAPGDRLEQRKLRQEIGEDFLIWADEYFGDETHLNRELKRKDIYEALLTYVGSEKKKYYTSTAFGRKLKCYCKLQGYSLNPELYNPQTNNYRSYDKDGRPIKRNVRNGVEYFTVGTSDFYELQKLPNLFEEIIPDA